MFHLPGDRRPGPPVRGHLRPRPAAPPAADRPAEPVGPSAAEQARGSGRGGAVEGHEPHQLDRRVRGRARWSPPPRRPVRRVPVDAGGDGREGHRAGPQLVGHLQRRAGSTRPGPRPRRPPPPRHTGPTVWMIHRAGQGEARRWPWRPRGRTLRGPRQAACSSAAPGGTVDGPVDTAASGAAAVGRVHDGVGVLGGDVAEDRLDAGAACRDRPSRPRRVTPTARPLGGSPGRTLGAVRLFVAVWPARGRRPRCCSALDRPDDPGVRWTTRDRWHVTLRFLGEVDRPRSAVVGRCAPCAAASSPQGATGRRSLGPRHGAVPGPAGAPGARWPASTALAGAGSARPTARRVRTPRTAVLAAISPWPGPAGGPGPPPGLAGAPLAAALASARAEPGGVGPRATAGRPLRDDRPCRLGEPVARTSRRPQRADAPWTRRPSRARHPPCRTLRRPTPNRCSQLHCVASGEPLSRTGDHTPFVGSAVGRSARTTDSIKRREKAIGHDGA